MYLYIITLAEAKNYLKLDDTLTEDDNNIERMIKASLMQLERKTNIVFYERKKDYVIDSNCALVYDYPINDLISPSDIIRIEKNQYSIYTTDNSIDLTLTLSVGYKNSCDVPKDLIEVAFEMIDIMYYAKESKLSMISEMTIDNYRRFII